MAGAASDAAGVNSLVIVVPLELDGRYVVHCAATVTRGGRAVGDCRRPHGNLSISESAAEGGRALARAHQDEAWPVGHALLKDWSVQAPVAKSTGLGQPARTELQVRSVPSPPALASPPFQQSAIPAASAADGAYTRVLSESRGRRRLFAIAWFCFRYPLLL